jgi:glycosyltransferase involved in cell wall biosynthesis
MNKRYKKLASIQKETCMNLKLSIIIPVYNTEKYIRKCIDSCLDQDLDSTEYEIILVDDGSTDNSLKILLEYGQKYNNITVLTQANKKQGAARNHGLKYAKGKYIWFVDSDDWVEANVLNVLTTQVEKNNLDILAFGARNTYEEETLIEKRKIWYKENYIYKDREVLLENKFNVNLPFHIFRRDFLSINNLELLENIYFEDNEFMIRVFDVVKLFMYVDLVCYNVLLRKESTTRTTNYSHFFGLITVIQSLIKYVETKNLPKDAQIIFSKHIAQCQNSVLLATRTSKKPFYEAVTALKNIDGLKPRLFQSNSRFHIIQFGMLKLPFILRKLLNVYYR